MLENGRAKRSKRSGIVKISKNVLTCRSKDRKYINTDKYQLPNQRYSRIMSRQKTF